MVKETTGPWRHCKQTHNLSFRAHCSLSPSLTHKYTQTHIHTVRNTNQILHFSVCPLGRAFEQSRFILYALTSSFLAHFPMELTLAISLRTHTLAHTHTCTHPAWQEGARATNCKYINSTNIPNTSLFASAHPWAVSSTLCSAHWSTGYTYPFRIVPLSWHQPKSRTLCLPIHRQLVSYCDIFKSLTSSNGTSWSIIDDWLILYAGNHITLINIVLFPSGFWAYKLDMWQRDMSRPSP